jgi:hypothetical protein
VGSTPTPTTNNGQCVTALFLSQGDKMSKKMSVNIGLVRAVSETWYFDIEDDADAQKIFEDIKANPNIIWTKFDSNLYDSDYYDELVTEVHDYEVE